MIIKPKMRGFICTTAHPVGCAQNVQEQIAHVQARPKVKGPQRVLVLGSSTGYGLASRIAATFGSDADSVGVFFEKPASGGRTASAGWYNNLAFEAAAKAAGRVAVSLNADAYSQQAKDDTIEAIRQSLPGGQVDMVVYSLAAPRRTDPVTGQVYRSVIKPIGQTYSNKTVDFHTGTVEQVDVEPATQQEQEETVAVMGGEDWLLWMQALKAAGVLAQGCVTLAYSYIGPSVTHAVYKDGTIGKAKEDVEHRAQQIDALLADMGGKAFVSVNKALVTQASSAIPVVPLYIAILYRYMKEQGTHEGCIEQMQRMLERMYANGQPEDWATVPTDEQGRLRLDDWEMEPKLQAQVEETWAQITTENLMDCADLEGYRSDFYALFGFGRTDVDYEQDVAEL